MTFSRGILLCVSGWVIYTLIDLVWLSVIAAPAYNREIGGMLIPRAEMSAQNIGAALATWLVLVCALIFFALPPAIAAGSPLRALGRGALLGFVAYAVYDLTNLAVIKGWTLKVSLLDVCWGTAICGAVSLILFYINSFIPAEG